MKQVLLLLFCLQMPLVLAGQSLSAIKGDNPDSSQAHLFYSHSASMINPRARVYYLQSISGQDTIRTRNYFLNVKIYSYNLSACSGYDSLYGGDYAFGGCVSNQGDTVMVCVNKDLSHRFTFPANTTYARPFMNGISIISSSPSWAFHAADSRYGAIAIDGTVLFEPTHNVVRISKDKVVVVDESANSSSKKWNDYLITVKNRKGEIETSFVFYYPVEYDVGPISAGNDFWDDINTLESSDFSTANLCYEYLTKDIYSALVNFVQLDFIAAHSHLKRALKSHDPIIKRCARKNLKVLTSLFHYR